MQSLKYKKYALMILSCVCIVCLLSVIWVFTGYFAPAPETSWVEDIYKIKEEYAQSIKGPKIVIVSGSSGLFGISAQQIESYFHIPTVNLSTHADLMDYYFDRAMKNLNKGDLVIISPEYHLYFVNSPMRGMKADYIVNFDKPYFRSLPISEKLTLILTYAHPWKILKNEALRFIDKFQNRIRLSGYGAWNLNKNGDETSNVKTKREISKQIYFPEEMDPNTYVLKKISGFIQWCHRENITVMVTWPGTIAPRSGMEQNQVFIHSLIVYLSNIGGEILGEPKDFFVPATYLYDTEYHLNREGVAFRTSKLIGMLEQDPVFIQWKGAQKGDIHEPPLDVSSRANPNICYNGDMEQSSDKGVSGWRAAMGEKDNPSGIAQWDEATAHTGRHSLRLENTSGQQVRWIGKKIILSPGIKNIQVSAWSKAKDIQDKATYCINLKIFFANGSFKWESRSLHFSKGTHDWEQVKSVSCFEEDIISIEPFLILYSTTGTAWFDDIDISMYAKR